MSGYSARGGLYLRKKTLGFLAFFFTVVMLLHSAASFEVLAAPLGVILALAVILGASLCPGEIDLRKRFFLILFYLIGIVLIQAFLPVLSGPDEKTYYAQLQYLSLSEIWSEFRSTLAFDRINFVSATIVFPGLLKAFGLASPKLDPALIAILNGSFWIWASFSWVDALKRAGRLDFGHINASPSIMLFLFLGLPSSVYWSSVFAKDIITVSTFILSAVALYDRRWIRAALWLIIATLLRPYAIAIILSFYVFLEDGWRKRLGCFLGAFGVLMIVTKADISVLTNAVILSVYSFFSPNPFNSKNWSMFADTGTWVFSPALLTAEAVILGATFLLGLFLLFFASSRVKSLFVSLLMSIAIGASVLALVGFIKPFAGGEEYAVGQFSGNVVRKKLSYWPLIVTWVGAVATLLLGNIGASRRPRQDVRHVSLA